MLSHFVEFGAKVLLWAAKPSPGASQVRKNEEVDYGFKGHMAVNRPFQSSLYRVSLGLEFAIMYRQKLKI